MSITRVAVIDDTEDSRESLVDQLEDHNIETSAPVGEFNEIDQLLNVMGSVDAAICDHHLNTRNFASFSGAELASSLYLRRTPAVLVTNYSVAKLLGIQRWRRHIPVLLHPDEANLDTLYRAWEICLQEFSGIFRPSRKAFTTLLRIDDVEPETRHFFAVVPAWQSDRIRISYDMLPPELQNKIGQKSRFYADVNLGAATQVDLYISNIRAGHG